MNTDFEKFMYLYYWGTVTEFNDNNNNDRLTAFDPGQPG